MKNAHSLGDMSVHSLPESLFIMLISLIYTRCLSNVAQRIMQKVCFMIAGLSKEPLHWHTSSSMKTRDESCLKFTVLSKVSPLTFFTVMIYWLNKTPRTGQEKEPLQLLTVFCFRCDVTFLFYNIVIVISLHCI